MRGPVILLLIATLLLGGFFVYPFVHLFSEVLVNADGELNTRLFVELFESAAWKSAFANTLLFMFLTGVLSLVLGVPLAWLITRTDLPLAAKFRSWFCLPYAIPPFILAIAWIGLANPSTGHLNTLFGEGTFNVYSFAGLVWIESCFLYTFVLLSCMSALDRMDSSFEEAARLSGASPLRVFLDVTLPLIRPAIMSGLMLAILSAAASFGVPALVGNPARIYLLTTQIYTFQKMGTLGGLLKAGALSMVLMLFSLALMMINEWRIKRKTFQTVSGKVSRPSLIDLGKWKTPTFVLCTGLLFIILILPLLGILISSFAERGGILSFDNFTLKNYVHVLFEMDETQRAIKNSLILAISASTIAAAIGILFAYIKVKTKIPGRNVIDWISTLPYSTPGTVVGLALILAFSQGVFGLDIPLYNTLGIIVLAYVVKYMSFSLRTSADGFSQIDDVLAEAARVSGAGFFQVISTIWIPLMKSSLIAAWFLVFMSVFSELTMTVLLSGPGIETVGTVLFQLQEYADSSGGNTAVLALLVVAVVITLNTIVKKLSNGRYGL